MLKIVTKVNKGNEKHWDVVLKYLMIIKNFFQAVFHSTTVLISVKSNDKKNVWILYIELRRT